MSIAESWPTCPARPRTTRARRSGISASFWANSSTFGRRSVPRSTSENGVGTWPETTRIISSGVTPFATIAATSDPALVPT